AALHDSENGCGDVFGSRPGEMRSICQQYLRDSRDGSSGCCRGVGRASRDEDFDVAAELHGGGNRVQRRRDQRGVIVLGQYQCGHFRSLIQRKGKLVGYGRTFASLRSFATSSFTSATRPPPLRAGGSVTLRIVNRGATSTPSPSGVNVSSGFFFARMMFGSVA